MDAAPAGIARHRWISDEAKAGRNFGISSKWMPGLSRLATLHELLREGKSKLLSVRKAIKELQINTEKPDPVTV